MKKIFKKRNLLLPLYGLLLLCCFQIKNVKFIMDDQSLFGFEIDLTEMEIVFVPGVRQSSSPEGEFNPQELEQDQIAGTRP